MRIALVTIGTRGDTQPYIAMGDELRKRGHDVVLSVSEDLSGFVQSAGLRAIVYRGVSMRALLDEPLNRAALAKGNVLGFLTTMKRENAKHQSTIVAALREALDGAHLVITHPLVELGACALARHHKQAVMRTMLAPLVPTGEFPSPLLMLPAFNKLSHQLLWWWAWQEQKRMHSDIARSLGVAPLAHGYHTLEDAKVPVAHLSSAALIPRPSDWPTHHVQTGACLLSPELRARLGEVGIPAELEAWLDEGEAPLFFGFGSMPIVDAPGWLTQVVNVCAKLKVRALVGAGWTQHGATGRISRDLFIAQTLDHDAVFPRCRAAVHHGGLGTTTAVLGAHLPALVCPVVADQAFMAKRVEALGAGVTVPFRRLTPERLAGALTRVLALPKWQGHIDNGTQRAVDLALSLCT